MLTQICVTMWHHLATMNEFIVGTLVNSFRPEQEGGDIKDNILFDIFHGI